MKEFNRQTVGELATALETTLKSLEKTYGVKFSRRGARFSPSNVTFKIDASIIGAGGEVMSRERTDYKLWCGNLGLDPAWLDQTFSWCGNTYKITGLKTRCWKSPVIVSRVRDNKSFKMNADMVINSFKLAKVGLRG